MDTGITPQHQMLLKLLPLRRFVQRLLEVLQQVLGGLDPHRKPQQAIADAEPLARGGCKYGVRSRRRAGEQTLHAAEAWCEGRDAQPGGELIGTRRAPCSSKLSTPPQPANNSRARACCGWLCRPG